MLYRLGELISLTLSLVYVRLFAHHVMRLLSCDCDMKSLDCNPLWVLLGLGLYKRRLSYDRCHLCEERPGSNSGKSRFMYCHVYGVVVRGAGL